MSDTPSQLDTKLSTLVDTIINATKAAGDFAMEQLPDLAMQMVLYGRAMSTTAVVFGIVSIIAAFYLFNRIDDDDVRNPEPYVFGGFFGGVAGSFAGFLLITLNINSFMLSWFAPKIYIIKEVASLLK